MSTSKAEVLFGEAVAQGFSFEDAEELIELIDRNQGLVFKSDTIPDEETQRDFMDEMRSDMTEEREGYDDDDGNTLSI